MTSATSESARELGAENVLVFGGTGLIGTKILDALIEAKTNLNRIAIFTSPTTLANKPGEIESIRARGVEIVIGDIRNEQDIITAYQGTVPCPSSLFLAICWFPICFKPTSTDL